MDNVLNVVNITQKFGGLVALAGVNIRVETGEIVGIIGPNGAGKTTLFNIITGIYLPTQGKVELAGEDVTGMKPYLIAEKGFARTFQNIRLFHRLTAMDNVMLGMHTRTQAGTWAAIFNTRKKRLEEKAATEKAEQLFRVLDMYEFRYNNASSLPYGLQRKLEIARALASEPKLLLLDEPAAGMNEQETAELMGIVRKLKEMGHTILLIEHDMKFVMNVCERIYVLDHGSPIAEGTPEEIKQNPAVIEAYLGKDV